MLALQDRQVDQRDYTDALGIVELQIFYQRLAHLLGRGYDAQFKKALGRVYCLIYRGGANRCMVAISQDADPVAALGAAMGKAGLLADIEATQAKG